VLLIKGMKLSEKLREKLRRDIKELDGVELKLLVWLLIEDRKEWIISYEETMKATGIASDKSLRKAIKKLMEMGYIERKAKGVYKLSFELTEENGKNKLVENETPKGWSFLKRLKSIINVLSLPRPLQALSSDRRSPMREKS